MIPSPELVVTPPGHPQLLVNERTQWGLMVCQDRLIILPHKKGVFPPFHRRGNGDVRDLPDPTHL